MATHSSVLAWRIPGTEEPGGLPSMESHMHVVLSASLVGSRLSLRMRGIPHHRRRVLILGSQREEQSNMIVDAKGV